LTTQTKGLPKGGPFLIRGAKEWIQSFYKLPRTTIITAIIPQYIAINPVTKDTYIRLNGPRP